MLKNARIIDVLTGRIREGSVAIKDGIILGISDGYKGKTEIDLKGAYVSPGFMDAHLHLEST